MIRCPCYGYLTMKYINADDGFCVDICPVCHWQFDNISNSRPDISIGPNSASLNQAKENYKKIGAKEERLLQYVRPPTKEEFADKRIKCPCCGYLTIVDKEDKNLIQDVCPVCFWQYNTEAINNPGKTIEPNIVSLNEARQNYKEYKASSKLGSINAREPMDDELVLKAFVVL